MAFPLHSHLQVSSSCPPCGPHVDASVRLLSGKSVQACGWAVAAGNVPLTLTAAVGGGGGGGATGAGSEGAGGGGGGGGRAGCIPH